MAEEDYSSWKRTQFIYDVYSNQVKAMTEGKTKGELLKVTGYKYERNNRLGKEVKKQGKITETWNYQYDDNGNETFRIWEKTALIPDYPGTVLLVGKRNRNHPTVYEWRYYNGLNHLVRRFQDSSETTYQYRGDGLRHCVKVKELCETQAKTKVLYWDGDEIVAEQTDNRDVKCYLRGGDLIARETGSMLYYYIFNVHGDVAQLLDQNRARISSYEYDAFGIEKNANEHDDNPFRYCGEYYGLLIRRSLNEKSFVYWWYYRIDCSHSSYYPKCQGR